jgi:hypothetical protein
MVQHVRPGTQTQVKVVPREGELEITLNINITVDGNITTSADGAEVSVLQQEDDDKVDRMIPDFSSGVQLSFGKEE